MKYEDVYEDVVHQLCEAVRDLARGRVAPGDDFVPVQPEGATEEQFAEVCSELGFNRMAEAHP